MMGRSLAVPKTSLDIITELSQPYSLTRQRLYIYIMIKRLQLEILQEYSKCIKAKRKWRLLLKRLLAFKKIKRKLLMKKRLMLALKLLQQEREYMFNILKKLQQYEVNLMHDYNLYPIFPLKTSNCLFRYIRSGVLGAGQPQDNVTFRLMNLTVSELAFIESQIQLFSMPAIMEPENKIMQLQKSLSIGLKLTETEAAHILATVLQQYSSTSQYALQCSWDGIKQVSSYIKSMRLQLRKRSEKLCVEISSLEDIQQILDLGYRARTAKSTMVL